MAGRISVSEAYKLLGLPRDAGMEEVKSAYRQRALECHPDTAQGRGSEDFIRITAAYRHLLRSQGHSGHSLSSDPTFVGHRYAPGRVVYASGLSGSRSGRTATIVWGLGLGLGGMLFAGILLLGRTMVPRTVQMGPTRVVEPTRDAEKRERINALLMEKATERGKKVQ